MLKRYEVKIEVAGPLAMFSRPDTGGTPTSYPVPTWSAAKGIFESIAFLTSGEAWFDPVKVEICRRLRQQGGTIKFQRYTTNYGGPLRKTALFGKGATPGGSSMQLFATVLSDVCYRLYAEIRRSHDSEKSSVNPCHHLFALFNRRLKQGRCYRAPCLGWSEFTCSYWGPFRDGQDGRARVTEVDEEFSDKIPSMLYSVWDRPTNGKVYQPLHRHEISIDRGTVRWSDSANS